MEQTGHESNAWVRRRWRKAYFLEASWNCMHGCWIELKTSCTFLDSMVCCRAAAAARMSMSNTWADQANPIKTAIFSGENYRHSTQNVKEQKKKLMRKELKECPYGFGFIKSIELEVIRKFTQLPIDEEDCAWYKTLNPRRGTLSNKEIIKDHAEVSSFL